MPADGEALTFKDQLRHLIATVCPLGRPYTLPEIVAGSQALGGGLKYDNLKLLYDGQRLNPSIGVVNDICRFYNVKVDDYFSWRPAQHESDAYASQLGLAQVMADAGVVGIAFRARGLSPENITFLKNSANHLRKLQGLEPVVDADEPEAPEAPGQA